jgi:hypothetical protein
VGDMFVQPLWLGWNSKHWDFALGYGFYAPLGRYDTETVSFSGGSFPAAYYGLFGDRIFEDFLPHFLKYNIQEELTDRMLSPTNWLGLSSPFYGRSDMAAEF